MTDIKEEYHLKNLSGEDAKKILETADQESIDIEKIIEFINKLKGGEKMSDEKMTEEQYTQKQKEDLEKIEEYIEKHPGTEYRDAVLGVLNKEELSEEEKKVEKYLEDHKSENLTYRQAVLACLDKSEPEPKKEE